MERRPQDLGREPTTIKRTGSRIKQCFANWLRVSVSKLHNDFCQWLGS